MANLIGQMLKQLADEKEAIDTTIAALEELIEKQNRISKQPKGSLDNVSKSSKNSRIRRSR